jgi:SAM-dependent methyltransferase
VTRGGAEFWDRIYAGNPDFFGPAASSLARSSLALMQREVPGATLVELGCGTGRDLVYFAQHGFAVRGCDLSPVAVRTANVRLAMARDERVPTAHASETDALTLLESLPAGGTDAVYSNLYLNLEVDDGRLPLLAEAIARVVRPDGFHLFSVRSTHDPWFGRGRSLGPGTFDPGPDGPPLRFFTESDLRRFHEPAFEVLSLREHLEGAPEFPVTLLSGAARRRGVGP